jgi:predicted glycosyltransferase
VRIFGRQKDCLPELLAASGWEHAIVPRGRRGLASVAVESVRVLKRVVRMAAARPFDLMVGTSIVVGPASRLTGATSLVFSEDDAAAVPLFAALGYGPAHYVITPRSLVTLGGEDHGSKHLTYPGYHELAYLHPRRFRPAEDIRRELGLAATERYSVVRLVALKAHHDIGQAGLSDGQVREVVRRLGARGRVFLSREAAGAADLGAVALPTPPERIHEVLAEADVLVGDSQTMACEAAVLGTPSLRCNTFVGRLSYLEELEQRYALTVGVRPDEFDRLLTVLDGWLADPELKQRWQQRRRVMLAECVDLTGWMLELFERLAAQRSRAGAVSAGRAPP